MYFVLILKEITLNLDQALPRQHWIFICYSAKS